MIDRFRKYLIVQIKRAAVLLPFVLAINMILLTGMAAFAAAAGDDRKNDSSKILVKVGLVGDFDKGYLNVALYMIENLDSSRFTISFVRADEPQAAEMLKRGEISSYIVVPDGFMEAIAYGEHKTIRYVESASSAGIRSAVTREIVDAISTLLVECENSVWGMQDFVDEYLPEKDPIDASNFLIANYFAVILARDGFFRMEETGVGNGQSFERYYAIALTTFFMMIWGVSASPLFLQRKNAICKLLRSAGLSAGGQIAAEFTAFLLLTAFGIGLTFFAAFLGIRWAAPGVYALIPHAPEEIAAFLGRCFPCMLMFGAVEFAVFEFAGGPVPALLIQTLIALFTGYLSGCFYPSYFFPPFLEAIGAYLPAGIAMRFLSAPSVGDLLLLFCIFAAAVGLAVWKRAGKLKEDAPV